MNDDRIVSVQTPHVQGRSMAADDSELAQQTLDEAQIRVALIRHAESVANTQLHVIGGRSNHSPLTAAGEQQAVELGEKLKAVGYSPDVIYSSPAVRTLETARIALAVTGYPKVVQVDDRLQELEQGEWTGRLRADTYTPRMSARIARSGWTSPLQAGNQCAMSANACTTGFVLSPALDPLKSSRSLTGRDTLPRRFGRRLAARKSLEDPHRELLRDRLGSPRPVCEGQGNRNRPRTLHPDRTGTEGQTCRQ